MYNVFIFQRCIYVKEPTCINVFFFFHTYEWLVKMSTVVTEGSSGAGTVNYQVLLTTETDYWAQVSFCNPFALVSTAGWYVGKAADFTGSSYTATPQGLKCSHTMNSVEAECPSVKKSSGAGLTCYLMSTYCNEIRVLKIFNWSDLSIFLLLDVLILVIFSLQENKVNIYYKFHPLSDRPLQVVQLVTMLVTLLKNWTFCFVLDCKCFRGFGLWLWSAAWMFRLS